ncbi:DUF2000 domain-containing protein [Paucidesulfovibrio longus]|uniref:DUF2000 domain-containing protein n=1 Tax=Paucidesulfovibrio longus TaxID=889 RepID=UPI0003B7A425|nr:DUF2000 domain-containing protein [Paucidesulfovibrio longus]
MTCGEFKATDPRKQKCVIVLDGALPAGLAANAAAVLAAAVFRKVDGLLGPDVRDADGRTHAAITRFPLPILKGDAVLLQSLHDKAHADERIMVAGFTHQARTARHYDDYTQRMAAAGAETLSYAGIALFGSCRIVNKLTGNLECL